jgi:hypothetical protein
MLLGPAITGKLPCTLRSFIDSEFLGSMMKTVGLEGIFLMEMTSFLLATVITMLTTIPRPTAEQSANEK